MCGITGLVGAGDRNSAVGSVQRMVCALARRGPDGEGLEVWDQAVLGHRRLAIFDLSEAGRQPMVSPDGSVAIVFNGAIYNFKDLREDLVALGYSFKSNTDTEVLIHGYCEWGIDKLVSKLRGMFAFGLWDDRSRKLFLVRDRLGVKPLVYAVSDGQLAFASTIRALQRADLVNQVDESALTEYLEFGFITDDRAIYKGAAKVPAASILEWSNGELHTRQYWTPPSINLSNPPSFDEAVEETERLFLQAVERRLHADVPVGGLLSGGVDSSLVCWAIARLGGDITAFTIGTPGDELDETSDAKATAEALGLPHCVLELSAADRPDINELISAYGEPFACPSALGMLRVSRAVAASATVLLTGDGGDDVFLGYPEHRYLWLAQKTAQSVPAGIASVWRSQSHNFPRRGTLKRAASFLDFTTGGLGAVACAREGLPMYQRNQLLGDRLAKTTIPQRSMKWSLESGRRVLEEFLEYDRNTRFVGEYLPKVDGGTMYYGLEARSPFLDQELWEFASSLPLDLRLHGGRQKAILRELARRRINDRVARGRKRGFSIPVQRWIVDRWRSAVEHAFKDSLMQAEGWVRADQVLNQIEIAARKRVAPLQLWYLFVFESWLRYERSNSKNDEDNHADQMITQSHGSIRN